MTSSHQASNVAQPVPICRLNTVLRASGGTPQSINYQNIDRKFDLVSIDPGMVSQSEMPLLHPFSRFSNPGFRICTRFYWKASVHAINNWFKYFIQDKREIMGDNDLLLDIFQ